MIAIVHSIYSQSVHAPALNAGLIDNDAVRCCRYISKEINSYEIIRFALLLSDGVVPGHYQHKHCHYCSNNHYSIPSVTYVYLYILDVE